MTDPLYTIRKATADDAAEILAYLEIIRAEPGVMLITQPGESTMTVEDEQKFITVINNSDNSIFLVAVDGQNNIVGEAHFRGGDRRLVRHTAMLGISVLQEWRDKGLGTALLARSIEWARGTHVLKRLELHVYAENARAVHVYEKLGFEVEGRLRHAIFRDERFYDELVMGLLLD